jgi:hypothetical protein
MKGVVAGVWTLDLEVENMVAGIRTMDLETTPRPQGFRGNKRRKSSGGCTVV